MEADFQHSDGSQPPTEGEWRRVTLPDQWIKDLRWEQGLLGWYRVALPDTFPDGLQALYLQRISTNVRVFLNEHYLGSGGSFEEPVSRNMHRPLFFSLPNTALKSSENYLYLQLRVYPGYAHLGAARIGAEEVLRPTFERQRFIQTTLSQIVFSISLLCGLVALLFGLVLERRSTNFFFALTTLSWSLYCLNLFVRDIPFSAKNWWALIHSNLEWAGVFLFLFCHRLLGVKRPWLEALLVTFAVVATLTYLYIDLVMVNYVARRFHFVTLGIAVYLTLWLGWRFFRRGQGEAGLVGGCLIAVVILGANDLIRQTVPIDSPDWQTPFYLLQFGAPAMFLILVCYLLWRYSQVMHAEQEAVAQVGAAKLDERERVYRDLHDDLGAKLLTMFYRAPNDDQRQLAKDMLGDLRSIVSSPTAGSEALSDLFGRIKAEVINRCELANLEPVVRLPRSSAHEVPSEVSNHLLKIIRELLNNSIKHANASQVTLHGQIEKHRLRLCYADDGEGDAEQGTVGPGKTASKGLGLQGIRRRVMELSGKVEFSPPPGARCLIDIPLPPPAP